jgi:hypothetical protein
MNMKFTPKETQTENNLLCVLPQDLQLQVSHEKPSGKPKSIDMLQNTWAEFKRQGHER